MHNASLIVTLLAFAVLMIAALFRRAPNVRLDIGTRFAVLRALPR
jgi:hypothetical protein